MTLETERATRGDAPRVRPLRRPAGRLGAAQLRRAGDAARRRRCSPSSTRRAPRGRRVRRPEPVPQPHAAGRTSTCPERVATSPRRSGRSCWHAGRRRHRAALDARARRYDALYGEAEAIATRRSSPCAAQEGRRRRRSPPLSLRAPASLRQACGADPWPHQRRRPGLQRRGVPRASAWTRSRRSPFRTSRSSWSTTARPTAASPSARSSPRATSASGSCASPTAAWATRATTGRRPRPASSCNFLDSDDVLPQARAAQLLHPLARQDRLGLRDRQRAPLQPRRRVRPRRSCAEGVRQDAARDAHHEVPRAAGRPHRAQQAVPPLVLGRARLRVPRGRHPRGHPGHPAGALPGQVRRRHLRARSTSTGCARPAGCRSPSGGWSPRCCSTASRRSRTSRGSCAKGTSAAPSAGTTRASSPRTCATTSTSSHVADDDYRELFLDRVNAFLDTIDAEAVRAADGDRARQVGARPGAADGRAARGPPLPARGPQRDGRRSRSTGAAYGDYPYRDDASGSASRACGLRAAPGADAVRPARRRALGGRRRPPAGLGVHHGDRRARARARRRSASSRSRRGAAAAACATALRGCGSGSRRRSAVRTPRELDGRDLRRARGRASRRPGPRPPRSSRRSAARDVGAVRRRQRRAASARRPVRWFLDGHAAACAPSSCPSTRGRARARRGRRRTARSSSSVLDDARRADARTALDGAAGELTGELVRRGEGKVGSRRAASDGSARRRIAGGRSTGAARAPARTLRAAEAHDAPRASARRETPASRSATTEAEEEATPRRPHRRRRDGADDDDEAGGRASAGS